MIKAEIIKDTIKKGIRISTLKLRLPKFILAELNTHRLLTKNSASSRAIPFSKIKEHLNFIPIYWGLKQSGMQSTQEVSEENKKKAIEIWNESKEFMLKQAEKLDELGIQKQTTNRLLEPFMFIETLCTATEWDNFFKLRISEFAQPEMCELATKMKEALDKSTPEENGYHIPFITEDDKHFIDDLFKVSSARCARVSYLKHNQEKPSWNDDYLLYEKLKNNGHLSPFEHAAVYKDNVSYIIRDESRQYNSWISYRVFIENNLEVK